LTASSQRRVRNHNNKKGREKKE